MTSPPNIEVPAAVATFRKWLVARGGGFHPHAAYSQVPSGFSLVAEEAIPKDLTIVRCPFDLAVTKEASHESLGQLLCSNDDLDISTKTWLERQWIATYICFHWLLEDSSNLGHYEYIRTLPPAQLLRTSLHFTPLELKLFEGTNLYNATLDREREWKGEWQACRDVVSKANPVWGNKFTWELYLSAGTYLSSRAFPSSLLSPNPSLQSSPTNKPVLLPGIDALNHARGQPVSWVVSYPGSPGAEVDDPIISLILHTTTAKAEELLNNYGPKPNSELILGYGFSLSNNPDDTIVLKVGGIDGKKWEVGREARGIEGLWGEILTSFTNNPDSAPTYENQLDAAEALSEMVEELIDRLPSPGDATNTEARPEVLLMFRDYVEGQHSIVESIAAFAKEKEKKAIEIARAEGVEIVLEG